MQQLRDSFFPFCGEVPDVYHGDGMAVYESSTIIYRRRYGRQPRPRATALALSGFRIQLREFPTGLSIMSLFGKKILVTRPEHQAKTLCLLFENAGATVFLQPVIDILPPESWSEVDQAIRMFDQFDFIIFASSNGVISFFEHFAKLEETISSGIGNKKDALDSKALLLSKKIIATGPGTAEQLAAYGVTNTIIPDVENDQSFDAEGIIALLQETEIDSNRLEIPDAGYGSPANKEGCAKPKAAAPTGGGIEKKRFLLVRGDRGRDFIPSKLQEMGGIVKQISVYRSIDRPVPDFEIANLLRHGKIDWVTVTSSAIAGSLVRMFREELRRAKLVSISPITSATLSELGHPPTVEATKATMQEIVNAVTDWENG